MKGLTAQIFADEQRHTLYSSRDAGLFEAINTVLVVNLQEIEVR